MEKQEYSQLDLFNKAEEGESSAQRLSGTFLSYIRTYERLVLMFIGLVITGSVCFCVGVEKGKHIALNQVNANLDIAYKDTILPSRTDVSTVQRPARVQPVVGKSAVPSGVSAAQVPARSGVSTQVPSKAGKGAVPMQPRVNTQPVRSAPAVIRQPVFVAQAAQPGKGLYTIQVATYKGKVSAQQEVAALKQQGLLPTLRSSGDYIVLSVGNFPDQVTAKSVLTQLKRKYRDCYIRRL